MRPRQAAPSRVLYRLVAVSVTIVAVWASGACERNDTQRVEFWTISLRPTFTDYIESRVAAFEAEHPGVDVVWVDVPFMAVERKFIAAAAAGRAPDVINLSDMMFARFAAAGAFTDLTLTLPDGAESAYHPGALRIGRLSGGLYALPWYLTTQATMSNASLLEKGGLSPGDLGSTWGDLMANAEVFYDRTGVSLFTQPLGQDSQLPMMLIADARPPFRAGPDGELVADLTREDVREYLAEWVRLYRAGVLPRECVTRGFEHLIDVYQDERVAALVTGVNFLGRIRDTARTVYDETEVRPAITGTLGRAHIAVMPVGVTSQSRDPELATAFALHITSAESQAEFCRLATILPSTPEAFRDPYFDGPTRSERAEGLEKVGRTRALVAETMDAAVPFTPAVECWPDLRRSFEAGMKQVFLDGADLGETLARTEREWQGIIDETNARRAAAGAAPAKFSAVPSPAPFKKPAAADNGTREGS
jgi:putative chitobiose transport system substrate-binding protein